MEYQTTVSEISLKKRKSDFPKVKILSSKDADKFIRQFYHDDIGIYESMFLILLNRGNVTTGFVKISQGGTAGAVVDIRLIAKFAVDSLSSNIILCHNHPSGNLSVSQSDLNITRKVREALSLFDIKIMDHLILTEDGYSSMLDGGFI